MLEQGHVARLDLPSLEKLYYLIDCVRAGELAIASSLSDKVYVKTQKNRLTISLTELSEQCLVVKKEVAEMFVKKETK